MTGFFARSASAFLLVGLLVSSSGCAFMHSSNEENTAKVTVSEDAIAYTLDNGIVKAKVAKNSGDLISMKYKGQETLATFMTPEGEPDLQRDPPGMNLEGLNRGMTDHQYGFWSHDAMGPRGTEPAPVATITVDPKSNGGKRAEVSIKGIANNRKMGTGPGSNAQGNFIADVDIRWTLEEKAHGVYTSCTFEHRPEYSATSITEARFCAKLADMFDWMLVDERRNMLYPVELERNGDNKYNYTANQFDNRAYGWASTSKGLGFFIINPSMEYMSCGPTKNEFLCHRDTGRPVFAPTVLNYWRSSHYGGSSVIVAQGEHWTKTIGPFMLYMNSGSDPQKMYKDAKAQAQKEEKKWPYDWTTNPDYPKAAERGTVKGQLVLEDMVERGAKMSNPMIGLTAPDYEVAGGGPGNRQIQVDWQRDAKNYQFWVRGSDSGRFTIPHVRAGTYTLHAYADGVLGEYARTDVTVSAGQTLDLGKLTWIPVRKGKQLWDIGIANRNGREFVKGDDYNHNGMQLKYAELFPNDVNYVIGKSDYRKDIYYQHVPHASPETIKAAADAEKARAEALARAATQPAAAFGARGPASQPGQLARGPAATQPGGRRGGGGPPGFGGPPQTGAATPWNITFYMPNTPARGKATLRLAISGTGTPAVAVALNNDSLGNVALAQGDATFGMFNAIQGVWYERELSFDASKMKAGANTLTLTVPAGPLTSGIMYDYIRLELDENAQPTASAAQ